jgi:hypothetical protein
LAQPVAAAGPKSRAAPPPPAEEPLSRVLTPPVETDLGGVFFLINLALALGLYGDFSTPDEPGIDLHPWDFVTLLARELLAEPAGPDDPVWALLSGLAGRRPRDRPGAGFAPSLDWQVPPEWVVPFGADGTWRWSRAGGRLRVEHDAGFLVLDLTRASLSALRPYGLPRLRRKALARESAVPLRRWVARVGRYAIARLALAGVDAQTLLRRPARVHVSPAHVDVVMALATLPLEIRRAGLDRDPGFVPATRRHLAFHFE